MSEEKKCPYCGKPFTVAVTRTITDRQRSQRTSKMELRHQQMEFCSEACGAYYQMGTEG